MILSDVTEAPRTAFLCHARQKFRRKSVDDVTRNTERLESIDSEADLQSGGRWGIKKTCSSYVRRSQPSTRRGDIFYTHKVEARLAHAAKAEARKTLNVIEI